jgi:thiamine biosynthesis lipoprotein
MSGTSETWVREARKAMGTRWEVVVPGEDRARLRGAAEEALDEVDRLEAQLSKFKYESEVSGINAFAAAGPVRVEPRLFALLQRALEVSRATDGAFDLTVGPLLRAWGFVGGGGRLPEPESIAAAREHVGWELIELDEDAATIRFRRDGVSLDLGAIGKGYAIDRSLGLMEDAGVECALIHGGTSTVYGLGAPPGAEGWRVALRDPRGGEQDALGELRLRDRALSLSGPHNRAFRSGDRLYGHVLDPRTGEPTQGALLAAVGHPSATLTDALSTALLVLGSAGLASVAAHYPDADLLVAEETPDGLWFHSAGPDLWQLRLAGDC